MKIAILAVCLIGVATAWSAEQPVNDSWNPSKFPISFWCAPPSALSNVKYYRQIAEAGFTYVMPPCDGGATEARNRRILSSATAVGLKVFIQDQRMPANLDQGSQGRSRLNAIVAAYANSPALAGYIVTDEPNARLFPGLASVVSYLRSKDPQHPAFINLYPNYANSHQLGTPNYQSYLRNYIERVNPAFISYDHYSFVNGSEPVGFIENLAIVSRIASQYSLPFWQIVQEVPLGSYGQLTESEKRWEALQSLAYGAKGLFWYTYWTPPGSTNSAGPAMVDKSGNLTPGYYEVKRINAEVSAFGRYLLSAHLVQVLNGFQGSSPTKSPAVIVSGNVTAGVFRTPNHIYVLIANRNFRSSSDVTFTFNADHFGLKILHTESNRWSPCSLVNLGTSAFEYQSHLRPGGGEMFRWRTR